MRTFGDERGFSLVELLVVIFVFSLMVLLIDAVFATVNRSSRAVELAADIQQNGRVAVERLTREIRESSSPTVQTGRVAFRSARLQSDSRWFCVNAADSNDPYYNSNCFASGQPLLGTYQPIWQAWIWYWRDTSSPTRPGCADGTGDLRREVQWRVGTNPLPATPASPTGGDVIATCVSNFEVTLPGSTTLKVVLDLAATAQVQGSNIPVQEMRVEGRTFIRN